MIVVMSLCMAWNMYFVIYYALRFGCLALYKYSRMLALYMNCIDRPKSWKEQLKEIEDMGDIAIIRGFLNDEGDKGFTEDLVLDYRKHPDN